VRFSIVATPGLFDYLDRRIANIAGLTPICLSSPICLSFEARRAVI
jgi:hypothetical protein